ncbi:hypothetical protein OHC33_002200 [Knufia fluminis]|uniref:Uncharacterized protein n=1 Tax=Knufia fluminis TaxID=191047 RepID=A0AAN8F4X0_9EURO|nr:hypothetical protein OHC33_002200 [Knufia fluminis]
MARLTELPDEIIDHVCSNLHSEPYGPNAIRIGLHSLSLASKKCNRIATPHLYHSVALTNTAAGLFALTLLRKPALAALVRVIDLEDYWLVRNTVDGAARTAFLEEVGILITAPDVQIAEREDEDPPTTDEEREDRKFHRRFTDFVLTRLPQLEVLALTLSEHLIDPSTTHALRQRSQKVLQNVKALEIRHWDTEYGFEMSEIMPFLAGNNITKVNLFACSGFGEATQICSSVEALQLDRTALEPGEFEKLVHCFPNLKSFALETADATVTQAMDGTPSAFQIGVDLRPLKNTLRSLTIDQRERLDMNEDGDDGPYSKKPIGLLKTFNKLEELVIWQFDLTRSHEDEKAANPDDDEDENGLEEGFYKDEAENYGDDDFMPWAHKLPRSLQTLKIIGATKEIEPGLWLLSEMAGAEFPNLKKVVSCRRVKGLKAAFQKTGITYSVDWELA